MSETCGCGCKHGAVAATGVLGPPHVLDETVETAAKRSPRVLAVLRELGIDTCCGGALTLAQAAASAGIPAQRLLQALGGRAETP
jgi:iron-sulfur cluster repair protein YtfE (RIC family)